MTPAEFGALYELQIERLYRFVYARVRDQATAEDVTSDVVLKALQSLDRYEDRGHFSAWLCQIARNVIIDRARTQQAADRAFQGLEERRHGRSAEDVAIRRDELRRIWGRVAKLPDQQRTALTLMFGEDMAQKDIGAVMGRTRGAIQQLVHRGVTTVREQALDLEVA